MALDETTKERIILLRSHGVAYARIARHLELNANSVKTFCLRNNITTRSDVEEIADPLGVWCLHCCERITLRVGSKFCCEECRRAWWKSHRNSGKPTSIQTCCQCGLAFEVFGKVARKFCSHPCFIQHRFGTRGGRK